MIGIFIGSAHLSLKGPMHARDSLPLSFFLLFKSTGLRYIITMMNYIRMKFYHLNRNAGLASANLTSVRISECNLIDIYPIWQYLL